MSALQFDEDSHTYRVDGHVVPSVTQIIAPLYSFDGIPESVLNAKRDLGKAVHLACEYDDQDDLDDDSLTPEVLIRVEAYRKFKRDVKPVVLLNEQKLYSPKYKFAGTIDRRYLIEGLEWTVDLKTTASMSAAVGIQLAAYDRLVGDSGTRNGSKMGALQLNGDGTYKLYPFTDASDFPVFLSLLNIHNWRVKNAKRN